MRQALRDGENLMLVYVIFRMISTVSGDTG